MTRVENNIVIEGARIGFRNFSGEAGKYNREGDRNFVVFLDTEMATELESDGWNIKWLQPRDPQDEEQGYLPVSVSFENYPAKVVLVTSNGKTMLNDDTVNILDWAEINHVDLSIRPYNWEVGEKTGVKAYVKTMYVVIEEDEFENRYLDVPDSAAKSITVTDDDETF